MYFVKTIFSFVFITTATLHSYAQVFDKKDPIDQFYEDCLHKDTASVNISNCAYETYGRWEKELDRCYNKLLKELKKTQDKNALIQSQKAWVTHRDAEFNSYNNMFNRPEKKWTFVRADKRVSVVKERVLQLRAYYQILSAKD